MIRKTAVVALGLFALAAGPAHAATPKKNTITAIGGMKLKANEYITDDQRWSERLRDQVRRDGDDARQVRGQPAALAVTDQETAQDAGADHGLRGLRSADGGGAEANPETGAVGKPVVEAGGEGFDTGGDKTAAGDSVYLPPKGKVTFKVTAAKGSTLNFVCAVHPWMLGKIKVK